MPLIVPLLWFRTDSEIWIGKPKAARLVAAVRRKSWITKWSTGAPMISDIFVSRRNFALLNPLTGLSPSVVNMSPLAPMRIFFAMTSRACVESGTGLAIPFFARNAGTVQIPATISSSIICAASSRRCAVSNKNLNRLPNGCPRSPHACQKAFISF